MALVKISGLAPITSITPSYDVIPCVHDGITKKITLQQIFDAAQIYINDYNGFVYNSKEIVSNQNIPESSNAQSIGPVTVINGVTVNIPSSSTWFIT